MGGPESTFSCRALTAQVKGEHALDLHLAGHTFNVIAAQVRYASLSSAYRAVGRAFQRLCAHMDQIAEQLRQLGDACYDRMLQAIDDKVRQGDQGAPDRALRISMSRHELRGLDAPTRVDPGVSPASAVLIAQWKGLREAPQSSSPALREGSYDVEAETVEEPGRVFCLLSARIDAFHLCLTRSIALPTSLRAERIIRQRPAQPPAVASSP